LCGDFKVHTFTGPGTFTVTNVGTPAGSTTVDYLVVAGGGGGGSKSTNLGSGAGGAGGAGGFRQSFPPAATGGFPVPAATSYPITVGAGGAVGPVGSCWIWF
jgi:MSHA biogenesis protein MshQ